MDFDRIKPTSHLKVERAGNQRERRRRHDDAADFHELLEADLDKGENEDSAGDATEDQRPRAGDTVSITNGPVPAPLVDDLVSISVQARLSTLEPEQADTGEAAAQDSSPVTGTAADDQPPPVKPAAAPPPDDADDEEPTRIDTLA